MSPEMRDRVLKSIRELEEPESFDEAELLFIQLIARQKAEKFRVLTQANKFYSEIAEKAEKMLRALK